MLSVLGFGEGREGKMMSLLGYENREREGTGYKGKVGKGR